MLTDLIFKGNLYMYKAKTSNFAYQILPNEPHVKHKKWIKCEQDVSEIS